VTQLSSFKDFENLTVKPSQSAPKLSKPIQAGFQQVPTPSSKSVEIQSNASKLVVPEAIDDTRAKVGFASEVINHPPIVEQTDFEEFKREVEREWLSGSAISLSQLAASIEYLKDIEYDPTTGEPIATPIDDLLGRKFVRFGQTARPNLFAAVFRNADGSVFQIRTNIKFWDQAKGRYAKHYLFPSKGNGSAIYLPPIAPETQLTHPNLAVVTEGVKKVQSTVTYGYQALSLFGCNGGYRVKDDDGNPIAPTLRPELLAALTPGQTVVLAFDQDSNPKTQSKVNKAQSTLARLLIEAGFKVHVAVWEEIEGKGIDDAIAALPTEKREDWLRSTLEGAPTFEQWQKEELKARRMRLALWLNSNSIAPERSTVGTEEEPYYPDLPQIQPGITVIQSSGRTGAGKTTALGGLVEANKGKGLMAVMMPTNSVGQQAAEDWKLPHRHDFFDHQNDLFLAAARDAGGFVMCPDSFHRLSPEVTAQINLVIFDEANDVVGGLCGGDTLKARQSEIVSSIAELLRDVIGRSGSIVLSEVTVYARTIEYMQAIAQTDQVQLFDHTPTGLSPWDIELRTGSTSGFFKEAIEALKQGKRLIFGVASQVQGEKLERLIAKHCPDKKVVRLDSKTNDGGTFADFWRDPNAWLRFNGIPDLLIYSPSGKSGVSITEPGFDEVWGHFTAHHPDQWQQMVGRYRLPVPRKLFIKPFIQSNDGNERMCSVRGVRRRLENNQSGFAKLHGIDLATRLREAQEAGEDVGRILTIESAIVNFLAAEKTAIGCQKSIAQDFFIHLLESRGHSLTQLKCPKDEAIAQDLQNLQEELWRETANILAKLQESDGKKNIPQWHQELLATKLRARSEFPGISFDDAEDCYQALVKDYGRMRGGALLQAAAENQAAAQGLEEKRVRAALQGRISLPHALPKAAMRAKLIELTGLLTLLDGESYSNSEKRAIAIKTAALKWKSEIYYWLGLEIKQSQTPVEICNKLLIKLGLKAEAVARPGTVGKRDRIYQVSGIVDPFRDRLLAAARQRLAEVLGKAPPDFDESSVRDGLQMLRDAEGDESALRDVWSVLAALPESDQREIQSRQSAA
jgi:Domain of unknown function (DUF3854)